MTEPPTTLLSVRGDAHVEVPPDLATLSCDVQADEREKSTALRSAAVRLDAVLADLRALGGMALIADAQRRPLGWTAYSASSYVESRWDQRQERDVVTGRIIATVGLRIEIRDLALMDPVGTALAAHEAVHVRHVGWSVDDDNPAWPAVRASAIDAAVRKGRDYAAALGGSLERIEHVADAGLLGEGGQREDWPVHAGVALMSHDASGGSASLDPVPQLLRAVIEARFTASVGPLA